jgi:hypothetical protein
MMFRVEAHAGSNTVAGAAHSGYDSQRWLLPDGVVLAYVDLARPVAGSRHEKSGHARQHRSER